MKTRALGFRLLSTLLLLLGLGLAGCDSNDKYVSVGAGHKKPTTGDGDAGLLADGSTAHLGEGGPSGGHGGTLPDGAPLPDGSLPDDDGGVDPMMVDPTETCAAAADNDEFSTPVELVDEGGFSLVFGPTGYGLVFRSGGCASSLSTLRIDAAGQFGKPSLFFDDCQTMEDVSLLWSAAGFRMAWIDNAAGTREVRTMVLGDDLVPPMSSASTRITDNALIEKRPTMADIAGVTQLAWIAENASKQRGISGKRLSGASGLVELVAASTGHKPKAMAMAQVGMENGVLAWVEEEESRGVWLLSLDASGAPVGAPKQLTSLTSTGSSVDVATRVEDGGAVIYSVAVQNVNKEVRFRRLDEDGKPLGDEVKIVAAPLQAKDASLARVAGGYVVTYRALPGGIITAPQLRMAFITKEGNPQRDAMGRTVSYKLADATADGGRTTVRVSLDGQILAAFVDGDLSAKKLRLVRQRLDCGL